MSQEGRVDPAKARRFESQRLHAHFGFEFRARSPGESEVALAVRAEHVQIDGVVHGGVLATLADCAAVHAVYPDLPGERTITSIEFKLNFLRAARPERGVVVARARALKVGRSVATCEVEVSQADALVAKGLFTYLILDSAGTADPASKRP